MFLALREIKHEKLRYGLITFMIFLIAYLIFMIWSLALGLAEENTMAITDWKTQTVILNKTSNTFMNQSLLTKSDLKNQALSSKEALVGQTQVVTKAKHRLGINAQFVGLEKDQFIYDAIDLTAGRRPKKANEITVSTRFAAKGYQLGDKLHLNGSKQRYTIVGFADNAMINIEPIIFGELNTWKKLRQVPANVVASGLISQRKFSLKSKQVKSYPVAQFIKKLPGYTEQNVSFEMMIAFLFIISLILVAVFMYILTMQKLPNYSVLRAQGIPAKTLIGATLSQSLLLVLTGVIVALIIMQLMVTAMPSTVPMHFSSTIALSGSIGMLIMGLLGGLIPVRTILKIDPVAAIGG